MGNYPHSQKINLANQLILAFLFLVYIPFLLVYSMDIYDSGFILSFVGRLREGQIIYKDDQSDLKNNNLITFAVDKNPKLPIEEGFYKSSFTKDILKSKKVIDSTHYFYILNS